MFDSTSLLRAISFLHPFLRHIRIRAQAGLIVLFPDWLPHFVEKHTGPRTRLSISFNLEIVKPGEERNPKSIPRRAPDLPGTGWGQDAGKQQAMDRLVKQRKGLQNELRRELQEARLWPSKDGFAACKPHGRCMEQLRPLRRLLSRRLGDLTGSASGPLQGTCKVPGVLDWPEIQTTRLKETIECAVAQHACKVMTAPDVVARRRADPAVRVEVGTSGTNGSFTRDLLHGGRDLPGPGSRSQLRAEDCREMTCSTLRATFPVRKTDSELFVEPLDPKTPVQLEDFFGLGSRADVSGILFGTRGFEKGVTIDEPRPTGSSLKRVSADMAFAAEAEAALNHEFGFSLGGDGKNPSNQGLMWLFPSWFRTTVDGVPQSVVEEYVDDRVHGDDDEIWLWHANQPHRFAIIFHATFDAADSFRRLLEDRQGRVRSSRLASVQATAEAGQVEFDLTAPPAVAAVHGHDMGAASQAGAAAPEEPQQMSPGLGGDLGASSVPWNPSVGSSGQVPGRSQSARRPRPQRATYGYLNKEAA